MSGFDKLETAQRLRDILARQATRIVAQEVPQPLIGRVITLDPVSLRGTVWFPGDDNPVDVKFFANTLPASWQTRDTDWNVTTEQTSTRGIGSTVVVQKFNGELYVTDVLTGGQFGFKSRFLGINTVNQQPSQGGDPSVFDFNQTIAGDTGQSIISVRVGSSQVKNFSGEYALMFGPFVKADKSFDSVTAGFMKIIVVESYGNGPSAFYEFAFNPSTSGSMVEGEWWRVLPNKEMNSDNFSQTTWDLDIKVDVNEYSTMPDGTGQRAVWMRIVPQASSSAAIYDIHIQTNVFDQAGDFSANQHFYQFEEVQGPDPVGFIGFHESRAAFPSRGKQAVVEKFNRQPVGPGWGSTAKGSGLGGNLAWSSTNESEWGIAQEWFDGGVAGPADDSDWVEGYLGYSTNPVTATQRRMFLQGNFGDVDLTMRFTLEHMPVTQPTQVGWNIRYRNGGGERIRARADVMPDGSVILATSKTVAGVGSNVGTNFTALPAGTFSPGEYLDFRVQALGSTVRMAVWPSTSTQPTLWQKTDTITDVPVAGQLGPETTVAGGATTPVPTRVYFRRLDMRIDMNTWDTDNNGQETWQTGPYRSSPLWIASALQKTWTCGGNFFWNGSELRWSDAIRMSGVGSHRYGLADGFVKIETPFPGIRIPRLPNNFVGGDYAEANANGIPLAPGEALYFGIPPGITTGPGGRGSINDYLFIVAGNDTFYDYMLPEWAVLIAARHPSSNQAPDLRLGDGTYLDRWRDLTLLNNWVNNGAPHWNAQYTKEDLQTVRLRGVVKSGTAGSVIANLPSGFRPTATHLQVVAANGGALTAHINVRLNGDIVQTAYGTGAGNTALSLDSVVFKLT